MKRKLWIAAALTAAVLSATACSGKTAAVSEQTTAATEQTTAAAEAAKTTAASEVSAEDEKLNEQMMREVAKAIQSNIADKNMEDLSLVVAYPCYVGVGEGVIVKDQAEFLALDVNEVITDEMVEAVKNADMDSLSISEAGLVVGSESGKPNITIGVTEDDAVGIVGINP